MQNLKAAVWSEWLKVYKSKIFWMTLVAFSLFPIFLGLMMFVLKNPDLARSSGLLGAKAQLIGDATWESLFNVLSQAIAAGGLFGFGFVTSWIFGREFSDRTAKDLLALPVSRSTIVWSKFIIILIWSVILSLEVLVLSLIAGQIVNITGWSQQLFHHSVFIYLITSILTILLSSPVAFFASYGRGFLPPLGFLVIIIMFAQFIANFGHGAYFPWAIPALYCGAAGPEQAQLGIVSFTILVLTSVIGLLATLCWWRYADHN